MKCKNCGAILDPNKAENRLLVCGNCSSATILYKDSTSQEAIELIEKGAKMLETGEFEEALECYKLATRKCSAESEAYWGMALAEFKVQFRKDILRNCMQPVRRGEAAGKFQSNMNYQKAMLFATAAMRKEYHRLALEIDGAEPVAGKNPAPAANAFKPTPAPTPAPAPAQPAVEKKPEPAPAQSANAFTPARPAPLDPVEGDPFERPVQKPVAEAPASVPFTPEKPAPLEPLEEEPFEEVAEEPVYEEPVAEPIAEEPVAFEEPAPVEPAYEEAAEEPVYEEPVAEPIAEGPAAFEEPAPVEPVQEEAAEAPVYEEPVAEEPAPVEEAPAEVPAEEPAPATAPAEDPAHAFKTGVVEEVPMGAPMPGFNPPMGAPNGFAPPMGAPMPGFNPPADHSAEDPAHAFKTGGVVEEVPMGGAPMPGFNPPMGAPNGFAPPMGAPMPGFNPPAGQPMPGLNHEEKGEDGQPLQKDPQKEFEIVNGEVVKYTGGTSRVVIPVSVTSIKESAFEGCKHISNVTIPNSVTHIGARAFANCHSLRVVFIPESVTAMEKDVFVDCSDILVINCGAEKEPKTWDKNWNKKGNGVFGGRFKAIWGYKS